MAPDLSAQMDLTADEVSRVLDALVSGELSREAAEDWATERMEAFDRRDLVFRPATEEERLWRAVTYLLGVALRDLEGDYLHDSTDLLEFRREVGL